MIEVNSLMMGSYQFALNLYSNLRARNHTSKLKFICNAAFYQCIYRLIHSKVWQINLHGQHFELNVYGRYRR